MSTTSEDEYTFPPMDSDDELDEEAFPLALQRNRDFGDLMWAICCRNCQQAVDANGYCYCTNQENSTPPLPKNKRKITEVVDLTTDPPKIISFMKGKK